MISVTIRELWENGRIGELAAFSLVIPLERFYWQYFFTASRSDTAFNFRG